MEVGCGEGCPPLPHWEGLRERAPSPDLKMVNFGAF